MNANPPGDGHSLGLQRVIQTIPRSVRGHTVAVIGELIGTISFLFFAFMGTQVARISSNSDNTANSMDLSSVPSKDPSELLYVSLAFGFSLSANAWVFARISGGLFNPAVTVGMVLIEAISIVRGVLLFITQIIAGIIAAALTRVLSHGKLDVRTTLTGGTTVAQGVIIEMILTAQLVFTIFMLAAEKYEGNFVAPVGIGLSLFVAELVGVYWTGGSLNPARSFGPAVAIHSFHSTQWIYWVGPLAGSLLAVIIYKIIKALEVEAIGNTAGNATKTLEADLEKAAPGPAVEENGENETRS